ncbi:MAG: MFS transporter [Bacteroidetes bacterium]|nr:MFS transporter [Bacteroidota bacterium]
MKNKSTLYLLFTANSISGFAQGISMLAIPWYFLNEFTINGVKSPDTFMYIYFAVTLVGMFWGLYSGILVDKYNRKSVMLGITFSGGVLLTTIAIIGFAVGHVPSVLVALVFASTFFYFTIHYPNLYAFAQEITEKKDYGKVTSYLEIQGQATSALAGAVAILLFVGSPDKNIDLFGFNFQLPFTIKKWELHEIFLLDGITYFVAMLLFTFIKYTAISERTKESGSIKERLITGVNFLRQKPVLFIFGNVSYSIFVIVLVAHFLLLPSFIGDFLQKGPSVYGASELFFSGGAVLTGIFIVWIFRKMNAISAIILMMFLTCGVMVLNTYNHNIWIYYLIICILGITNAGTRVMRVTYLFNHIPNNVIGRVSSVFQVINVLIRLSFVTLFVLPFFSDGAKVANTFMVFGIFCFLSALVLMRYYKKLIEA